MLACVRLSMGCADGEKKNSVSHLDGKLDSTLWLAHGG